MVTPGQMQMFNKPEPYESQILGSRYNCQYEYEPFLNIDNAGTYKIRLHDHTLGNALRMQLLKDRDVLFAGYRIPHPMEPEMHLRIQTVMNSKNEEGQVTAPKPQGALLKANKLLLDGCMNFNIAFREEAERIGLDLDLDAVAHGEGAELDEDGNKVPKSHQEMIDPETGLIKEEEGFFSGLQEREQEVVFKRFAAVKDQNMFEGEKFGGVNASIMAEMREQMERAQAGLGGGLGGAGAYDPNNQTAGFLDFGRDHDPNNQTAGFYGDPNQQSAALLNQTVSGHGSSALPSPGGHSSGQSNKSAPMDIDYDEI